MAFKLDSIFNQKTLSQATDSYKVQYIERSKIVPNDRNKEIYNTNKILLLSYGIEDKGLLEPLIVKKESNGTYTLLSGHRRLLAIAALVERNPDKKAEFDVLPCIERNDGDENEEILIDANIYNRDKSDAEKAAELQRKKEILEQRKANGEKINGRLLELIAGEMNISYHQAKKLNAINNNATEQVHDAFKDGEISTETAYQISKLDEDKQNEIIESAKDNNSPVTAQLVKDAIAAAKPKIPITPKSPLSDGSEECNSCDENIADLHSEKFSQNEIENKNSNTDISAVLNSNTTKTNESKNICEEIARIMKWFAVEDEIILSQAEVLDVRNILERVLLTLT